MLHSELEIIVVIFSSIEQLTQIQIYLVFVTWQNFVQFDVNIEPKHQRKERRPNIFKTRSAFHCLVSSIEIATESCLLSSNLHQFGHCQM